MNRQISLKNSAFVQSCVLASMQQSFSTHVASAQVIADNMCFNTLPVEQSADAKD
jgi:hypothetical protein